MWANESVFYQIYPLGMTGAPFENDGVLEHRILKVIDWIPHLFRVSYQSFYNPWYYIHEYPTQKEAKNKSHLFQAF